MLLNKLPQKLLLNRKERWGVAFNKTMDKTF